MASSNDPQLILYDLACTKNTCFSPVVWRIRLMLAYKKIPYKTVFLEFPDIEPTLKGLGIKPNDSPRDPVYSVPAIHHLATNKYIMHSIPIAAFLEATYPTPPLPLTSSLGKEIEAKAIIVMGTLFQTSIKPRELNILSPNSQEYYRRTREAALGHPLEDLIEATREEKVWEEAGPGLVEVGELLQTNKAEGPFVLGKEPSYTDFYVVGALMSARVVNESVFERIVGFPGFKGLVDACEVYAEKRD